MSQTIANVLVGVVTISVNPTAGTAVGDGGWVDLGYTADGVTFVYTVNTEAIKVLAETFAIGQIIRDENIDILCHMAEASLANDDFALAVAVLAGSTITLDAGAVKELALKLVGRSPDTALPVRTIYVPYCTAVGAVQQSFRKADKTLIPFTFRAFKSSGVRVCTIEDSA